ncbi:hypothetical protein PM729_04570 [Enterococcus mundtii]|nr:hypothetical protein [Enterococcus mundtii]MDB7086962.1 hypothetical protein [Enterococcus mundtii]STD25029.1 Uncharacterised protein [Enterococcus mundtii]
MKRISISKAIRRLRSYLYACATGEERKGIEKAIAIFESMEEEK